jgi:hypothetical protein
MPYSNRISKWNPAVKHKLAAYINKKKTSQYVEDASSRCLKCKEDKKKKRDWRVNIITETIVLYQKQERIMYLLSHDILH